MPQCMLPHALNAKHAAVHWCLGVVRSFALPVLIDHIEPNIMRQAEALRSAAKVIGREPVEQRLCTAHGLMPRNVPEHPSMPHTHSLTGVASVWCSFLGRALLRAAPP
jgi:hypothetical protein